MKRLHVRLAQAARVVAPAAFAISTMLLPAAATAGSPGTPPRPKGSAAEPATASEAKALADWTLTQPQVAARIKGHRTRLLRVGFGETSKETRTRQAVLYFRDYDSGGVLQTFVNLESGQVELKDVSGLVQPSREELGEGMAIALRDPGLVLWAADPALRLMGGFHNRSPYPDDPCSKEVCLEFAFMRPGPAAMPAAEAEKRPPRRVIVNLSRGAVVNRDYKANADAGAPSPRMTAIGEEQ